MQVKNNARNILKFCADKRKMQLLQERVKSLSQTVVSLADDIHSLVKASTNVEDTLKAVFPCTVSTVQRNNKRFQALEEQLFPMLPETGKVYLAQVVRPCVTSSGKEGYWCMIPMKPAFHFAVECTNTNIDATLVVKCLDASKEEFQALTKEEYKETIIHTFEEPKKKFAGLTA